MLKYAFGTYRSTNPITGEVYDTHRLGVEDPYWMLSYIGDVVNDPSYISEIIQELEQALQGKAEVFSWGSDMALVHTQIDKSTVEYMHDTPEGVKESQLEIPTEWLLSMMKDWKEYLNNPEKKIYS